jgi:hypothetical protein
MSSLRCRRGGRIAPTRALFTVIPGECLKPETAWWSGMDSNRRSWLFDRNRRFPANIRFSVSFR